MAQESDLWRSKKESDLEETVNSNVKSWLACIIFLLNQKLHSDKLLLRKYLIKALAWQARVAVQPEAF